VSTDCQVIPASRPFWIRNATDFSDPRTAMKLLSGDGSDAKGEIDVLF